MRCLLLAFFGLSVLAAQDQQRFTVSGKVINSVTGEPVRGAMVQINSQETRHVMTGSDGRFEQNNIGSGSLFITAQRPGFSPSQQNFAVGANAEPVVLKLVPLGQISGRVMDSEGEPVDGINVQCMQEMIVNGRKRWQPSSGASTDDTGHFLIGDLSGGAYIVHTGQLSLYPGIMPRSEAARYIYPETYYPNGSSLELAQYIEVGAGEDAKVDIAVHSTRGAKVSLTTEPSYPNVIASINDGENRYAFKNARSNGKGILTFAAVPSGTWKIEVHGPFSGGPNQGEQPLYGEATVEVGSTDITNLKIPLNKLPDIAVSISGGAPGGVSLQLMSNNGINGGGQPDQSGGFVITGVAPGSYSVVVQPRDTCLISMMSGSVDLLRDELVVSAGASVAPIQIVKGDNCGSLNLTAKTAATAILLSNSKAFEPQIFGLSPQGTTATALREGEYRIYAFDDITNVEYANPEAMRNYKSQTVQLEAGQKQTVQLEVNELHPR